MLEDLADYLIEHQYLSSRKGLNWSARLTGNWSVICFRKKKPLYFIKLEQFKPLEHEFSVIQYWHKQLPKNLLKPLHFGRLNLKQLYIQEAKVHRNLHPYAWKANKGLQKAMLGYFNAQKANKKSSFCANKTLLSQWKGAQASNSLAVVGELSLPAIPQHGDMTLTNLGFDSDLLFFDWEDFGVCDYPLLDVTTFVMSLCNFDINRLYYHVLQSHDSWLKQCLSIYSCSTLQFLQCLPYSLAEFLNLKVQLGYGEEVIQKTKKAIETSLAFNQGLFDA